MFKKLSDKKSIILAILVGIIVILCAITIFFGNGENKITVLILTPILFVVIYAFARLMLKIIEKKAPRKLLTFFGWFFLIGGAIGYLSMIVEFIVGFPNGLSPTLGACAGLVASMLDVAKKLM